MKVSLIALATLMSAPALAQQEPVATAKPTASEPDAEIIVTARKPGTQSYRAEASTIGTKTDTPLVETPVSASVVTRQFMDDTQVTTITEALRFVPSVYSGDNGRSAVDENLSIRGFSYLRSTFVDGTRQQAYNVDVNPEPYGLERLEVLRGAASVLYGSTQPGGIVNAVSRRPRLQPSIETLASGGSLGLVRLGFDATGEIGNSGKVAARLTGFFRNQDDIAKTAFNDRRYIAPAVSFFPSPATEITLLGSYQHDHFRQVPYLPARGTLIPDPNGVLPRNRFLGEPGIPADHVDTLGGKLLVSHAFSDDVKFHFAGGYRHYDRFETYVYVDIRPTGQIADREIYPIGTKAGVWSSDANLQIKGGWFGAEHTILVGTDYYKIHDRTQTTDATLGPINIFNPVYGTRPVSSGVLSSNSLTTLDQFGAYLQDQVKIGGRLVLLGGGRYDRFTEATDDPIGGYFDRTKGKGSFTGRAGVVYLLDGGFAPYASWTQGFYPMPGTDRQGRPFDPDRSAQFEAGVKYESPDKRSSASVALFTINRTGLTTPDPVNRSFSIQTGEQRHRGVELEFNVALTSNLGVLGSYSYLDARFTKSNRLQGGLPIQGKRVPNLPEHSGSIWAVYSFDRDSSLHGLSLSLGGRAQSSREGDRLNTYRTPSFGLIDASIAYSVARWRFAVNAVNLTDKKYYAATTGYSNYVRYGDPRLILASVQRSW